MKKRETGGVVLDAGALLSIERGGLTEKLLRARALGLSISLSAGVVAQTWRGGPRGARLATFFKRNIRVVALDVDEARRVGEFIAKHVHRGARPDIVDAHTALLAMETKSLVYTSDVGDLERYGVPPERLVRV